MQLVAASKMRRAIERTVSTHDYTHHAHELLRHLSGEGATEGHPFFTRRPLKNRLLLVISSDTGLAGAYNANVFKRYVSELESDRKKGVKTSTIALGRKISQFAARLRDNNIVGTYNKLSDDLSSVEFQTVLATALDGYSDETYDAVDVIFTRFKSSITQEVTVERLLPAGDEPDSSAQDRLKNVKFEPSTREVLDAVIDRLIEAEVAQALLDAIASEHSMRMMAMKNATDNARGLVDDLTLAMNKERQAAITQELSEISNGAEAVQ
jgi:F-type H+-transporting ATPase subunit gamma